MGPDRGIPTPASRDRLRERATVCRLSLLAGPGCISIHWAASCDVFGIAYMLIVMAMLNYLSGAYAAVDCMGGWNWIESSGHTYQPYRHIDTRIFWMCRIWATWKLVVLEIKWRGLDIFISVFRNILYVIHTRHSKVCIYKYCLFVHRSNRTQNKKQKHKNKIDYSIITYSFLS